MTKWKERIDLESRRVSINNLAENTGGVILIDIISRRRRARIRDRNDRVRRGEWL